MTTLNLYRINFAYTDKQGDNIGGASFVKAETAEKAISQVKQKLIERDFTNIHASIEGEY